MIGSNRTFPHHRSLQDPLYLDRCITCWEQEWEDCFEVQEFAAKEGFIFKAEDIVRTRQWFRYHVQII